MQTLRLLSIGFIAVLPTLALMLELRNGTRRRGPTSSDMVTMHTVQIIVDAANAVLWLGCAVENWRSGDWPVVAVTAYSGVIHAWLAWLGWKGGGIGRRLLDRVRAVVTVTQARLTVTPIPAGAR